MARFFIFLFGFGLSVVGLVYIISYLNLLAVGYNFLEYVNFICRKGECIVGFIGIIIVFLTIFTKERG